jgi:hypothetical protein
MTVSKPTKATVGAIKGRIRCWLEDPTYRFWITLGVPTHGEQQVVSSTLALHDSSPYTSRNASTCSGVMPSRIDHKMKIPHGHAQAPRPLVFDPTILHHISQGHSKGGIWRQGNRSNRAVR